MVKRIQTSTGKVHLTKMVEDKFLPGSHILEAECFCGHTINGWVVDSSFKITCKNCMKAEEESNA